MLNKIGIENFRIFKDLTELEIAPVTILTGPNNSGKSSFIKLLSLLQYSFTETDRINKLNFDGGNHNLGTFEKVTSFKSNSNLIKINVDIFLSLFDEQFQLELIYADKGPFSIKKENGHLVSIKIYNKTRVLLWVFSNSKTKIIDSDEDAFFSIDIDYLKQTINKELDLKKEQLFFNYYKIVNNEKVNLNKKYFEIFKIFETLFPNYCHFFQPYECYSINYHKFEEWMNAIFDFRQDEKLAYYLSGDKPFSDNQESNLFTELAIALYTTEALSNNEVDAELPDLLEDFKTEMNDIVIAKSDTFNYDILDSFLFSNIENGINKLIYSMNNVNHLSVNRGSQKRILSNASNNQIDEIVKEYSFIVDQEADTFIDESFKILGINGKLVIDREEGILSKVYIENGDTKTLLADLGYGYSQIIPILLKVITISTLKETEWYENNPYSLKDIPENKATKSLIKARKKSFERVISLAKNSDSMFSQELIKKFEELNNEKFLLEYDTIFKLLKTLSKKQKEILLNNELDLKQLDNQVTDSHELFMMFIFPKDYLFDFDLVDKETKFPILIIEEPEANLHPNLQSKLADIVVLAYKNFGIHFILESHSEYLIRKLQYLTAKKDVSKEDVSIYYFNSDEYVTSNEKKVKHIKINEFGGLTDSFGPGFFDEATSLKFELLKLNKSQQN